MPIGQSPSTSSNSAAALMSRRHLFQRTGYGLGAMALGSLLAADSPATAAAQMPAVRQLAPRAKSVIFLHMVGAPSHLDLFDYKAKLVELDGTPMPDDLWKGLRLAFIREKPNLLGTRFPFRPQGESGLELSSLLPHLSQVADEICLLKGVHTEHFNHAPAQLFFQTGFPRFGRPSLGSWLSYGLGSENQNLPAYVVMITGAVAGAGNSLWGSGFLPSVHQGIEFRSQGDPVLFLSNPPGMSSVDRELIIDGVNDLNREQLADVGDPEIATRIDQYEMAFRMQASVPELMETKNETAATHQMYGTQPGKPGFASNCLLARRLVERGVRFVQLYDESWDHHSGVFTGLPKKCREVDQPIAALITDLKQRGLLDETLVVWGSEFGRTPMVQGKSNDGAKNNIGRDHHKDAFTLWMAGGGVKGGLSYGQTDEIGFSVVEDPMHVNDFHATLLHLLGIDHEQLTFKFQGRNFRLTDVAGKVATPILR